MRAAGLTRWLVAAVRGFSVAVIIGLCAHTAGAHLGTPYGDAMSALQDASAIALVRVVRESRDTAEGVTTEVDTLAAYVGRPPRRLTIRQPPPHVHRHRVGEVFVAPLGLLTDGVYLYSVETATALHARPDERRDLAGLVKRLRALPRPTPADLRIHHALREVSAPRLTTLGRRLILEALVARPDRIRDVLDSKTRAALVHALASDTNPVPFRLGLVRVIGLAADGDLTRALCERVSGLRDVTLRATALETLADGGGACAGRVINRCREAVDDPLRDRCATLARRMP